MFIIFMICLGDYVAAFRNLYTYYVCLFGAVELFHEQEVSKILCRPLR